MKTKTFLIAAIIITFTFISCGEHRETIGNTTYIREGVGLGSIIAVVTSWSRNQSILWAILHGIFSWFYVIYFALTREHKEKL